MTTVFFGLGSNIEPEANLRSGVVCLNQLYGNILVSPVYLSPPFGFAGKDFYNMAVGLETGAHLEELIEQAHIIEDKHGRNRSLPRYSSRTLDIDLLLYGDMVCDEPTPLPRPDILRHAFVLQPLADIAGDIMHPTEKRLLREIREEHRDSPLPQVHDLFPQQI